MTEKIKSLLVLGLGKVGSKVAALLQETGFEVIGADMNDTDGMTFPVKKINQPRPKGWGMTTECSDQFYRSKLRGIEPGLI